MSAEIVKIFKPTRTNIAISMVSQTMLFGFLSFMVFRFLNSADNRHYYGNLFGCISGAIINSMYFWYLLMVQTAKIEIDSHAILYCNFFGNKKIELQDVESVDYSCARGGRVLIIRSSDSTIRVSNYSFDDADLSAIQALVN